MNAFAKVAIALVVFVVGFESSAQAFQCIGGGCPRWCETAPYGIQSCSSDLPEAECISEVRRGMDDWTRVECSALETNYTGRTNANPGSIDNQSVIGWAESNWGDSAQAIGVTRPVWAGNCFREADMRMNGVNYRWITGSGAGQNVNLYSITLHEGGHYYGLGHSNDPGATMYFAYQGGIDTIGADDTNGICTLYPGGGGSGGDCTTRGCPSGQECVGAACQPIVGDGTVCAPCQTSEECGSANDFCIQYPPSGQGFCGKSCRGSGECGGDVCVDVGGTGQCIRVSDQRRPDCGEIQAPGGCTTDSDCTAAEQCRQSMCVARPTDKSPIGTACSSPDECNSGVCLTGVCTQSCDSQAPATSCPSGFYCDIDALGVCGAEGICSAGSVGASPQGTPCTADTECESLHCVDGSCGIPCQPEGASLCPENQSCQTTGAAGCGACKLATGLGGECDLSEDCISNLCIILGGDCENGSCVCAQFCDDTNPCPEGFACTPAGEQSVCVGGDPVTSCDDANPCPDGSTCTDSMCVDNGRDSGCACQVPGSGSSSSLAWLMLGLMAFIRRRR